MGLKDGWILIGKTAVDSYIRAWKQSYLGHVPAWPAESIMAKIVEYMTRLDPSRTHTDKISDGELVANIVADMRYENPTAHVAFIARHLRVVDGKRYPKSRDYQLAQMLNIKPRTFRAHHSAGYAFVREKLDESLDSGAAFWI